MPVERVLLLIHPVIDTKDMWSGVKVGGQSHPAGPIPFDEPSKCTRRVHDREPLRRWFLTCRCKTAELMDTVLWQTLAGTRGGPNRARILRALSQRPRNANQLAEDLELAYNTVRHHLEVLEDNDIITSSDESYGTVYLPSERAQTRWDTIEQIISQIEET